MPLHSTVLSALAGSEILGLDQFAHQRHACFALDDKYALHSVFDEGVSNKRVYEKGIKHQLDRNCWIERNTYTEFDSANNYRINFKTSFMKAKYNNVLSFICLITTFKFSIVISFNNNFFH